MSELSVLEFEVLLHVETFDATRGRGLGLSAAKLSNARFKSEIALLILCGRGEDGEIDESEGRGTRWVSTWFPDELNCVGLVGEGV